MYGSPIIVARTKKDVHFIGAINQDSCTQENLTTPRIDATNFVIPEGLGSGGHMRARLRAIRILSKENLAWEIWLFGSATFATANADTERFLGVWGFADTDGKRATVMGGVLDTYFHYYTDGLDIGTQDFDLSSSLHVRLVNRSAAAKSAGVAGEIVIELAFEPTEIGNK